MNNRLEG